MEYKKQENERATKGNRRGMHEDEHMHTILFAAGTALTMACLQRITMVFFVEQWRARVFVVLNLVLLAIVFTSIRSTNSSDQDQADQMKVQRKKREECSWPSDEVKASKECEIEQDHIQVDSESCKLSKEELNERAEAFIAMFRQQLVSDARKSRHFKA